MEPGASVEEIQEILPNLNEKQAKIELLRQAEEKERIEKEKLRKEKEILKLKIKYHKKNRDEMIKNKKKRYHKLFDDSMKHECDRYIDTTFEQLYIAKQGNIDHFDYMSQKYPNQYIIDQNIYTDDQKIVENCYVSDSSDNECDEEYEQLKYNKENQNMNVTPNIPKKLKQNKNNNNNNNNNDTHDTDSDSDSSNDSSSHSSSDHRAPAGFVYFRVFLFLFVLNSFLLCCF